jgi:hypothetical protein
MLKSSHMAYYMMIWKKKIEWKTKQGFNSWKNKILFVSLFVLGSLVQEQIQQFVAIQQSIVVIVLKKYRYLCFVYLFIYLAM